MPRKPLRSGELARMIAQCGGQKLSKVAAHRQVLRFGVTTPPFVPGECEGSASGPHRRHGDGSNRSREPSTVGDTLREFPGERSTILKPERSTSRTGQRRRHAAPMRKDASNYGTRQLRLVQL